MYCATCGTLIDENLNYCNRCGNRVAKDELVGQADLTTVSLLKNLSIATGFVGVVGLGGLIGLIGILIGNNAVPELIVILSILFLATTFAICFLLTRQISRLSGNLISNGEKSKQKNAPEAGQIEPTRQSFLSVTENTTRTLDKTKV